MGDSRSGSVRELRTLLGDYPGTRPLKDGTVRSPDVAFDFVAADVPNRFFKRVVRERVFEVAELAIATFLQAKSLGRPLVLLPVTVLGRHQHALLVYNPERGALDPARLAARRVGIRSYSVTTVMWVRGVLARDHGVDLGGVRWVTFEDAHVEGFEDPPGVERAPADKDPQTMLLDGELDAAVLGAPPPAGSPLRPLIRDPRNAALDWCRRNGAVPVNHLVVVDRDLSRSEPGTVTEVYRLLIESRRIGAPACEGGLDLLPSGVEALRPSLALAIEYADEQGLLSRRLTVDELYDDTTRAL